MEKKVIIQNETGIHARPASAIVKKANEFKSHIEIGYKDKTFNAKSIISIMSMGLGKGSEISIIATGEDETEAVGALVDLIENHLE